MNFDLPALPPDCVLNTLKLAQKHLLEDAQELALRAASLQGALRYLEIAIATLEQEEDEDA